MSEPRSLSPVNLHAALDQVGEPWQPLTVAVVNDYDVRVARGRGEFPRHTHPETDEFFLVLEGRLTIRMDTGSVDLDAGDSFVVPAGTAHQPDAGDGATFVLLEPSATVNTGDSPGELTAVRRTV